jgi:hypothetical protein
MKPSELNLSITPKLSKLGRPYRLSAIAKNLQVPSKWINKVEHWHWYYFFIYTDDNSFFGFEFDYNDKLVKKLTHEETLKLFTNG